jgi:hypothetical protein
VNHLVTLLLVFLLGVHAIAERANSDASVNVAYASLVKPEAKPQPKPTPGETLACECQDGCECGDNCKCVGCKLDGSCCKCAKPSEVADKWQWSVTGPSAGEYRKGDKVVVYKLVNVRVCSGRTCRMEARWVQQP